MLQIQFEFCYYFGKICENIRNVFIFIKVIKNFKILVSNTFAYIILNLFQNIITKIVAKIITNAILNNI